jgi:hypothetical protein
VYLVFKPVGQASERIDIATAERFGGTTDIAYPAFADVFFSFFFHIAYATVPVSAASSLQ